MSYYIETQNPQNKFRQILESIPQAQKEQAPFYPTEDRVGVCVVQNGPFDAAAIAYSKAEANYFNQEDGRHKDWLSIPKEIAIQLCPRVKDALK
jgi:hypothetical protein